MVALRSHRYSLINVFFDDAKSFLSRVSFSRTARTGHYSLATSHYPLFTIPHLSRQGCARPVPVSSAHFSAVLAQSLPLPNGARPVLLPLHQFWPPASQPAAVSPYAQQVDPGPPPFEQPQFPLDPPSPQSELALSPKPHPDAQPPPEQELARYPLPQPALASSPSTQLLSPAPPLPQGLAVVPFLHAAPRAS
jgi:hypothetical protein